MTTITAYRRIVTRAPSIDETGTTLQWQAWDHDDRWYTAYDEPITLALADDWQQLVSIGDEPPILYHPVDGAVDYTVREAIDLGIARIVGGA